VQSSLAAINHPHRRAILRLVWDAELSSRDIASNFDVTWQAVSHNLRVLREAGLVSERREGTRRLYLADREGLGPLEGLLTSMWAQDLERLGDVIATDRAVGPAGE
jgi:DNA-binding transcriptional ArsR family regulator